ncbi:MAG: GAF domain-containing sensor histidine kinase [Acidimicrobiia bacterium]
MIDKDGRAVFVHGHGPSSQEHGLLRIGGMWRIWQVFRIVVCLVLIICGVGLAAVWGWNGGFVVAVLAAVALIGAVRRYESPVGSPLPSLLLDFTLIGVALVIVDVAPAGIGAALLYMMAIPVVFLPWRRALPLVAYGLAWSLIGLRAGSVWGPSTSVPEIVVTSIAVVAFGGLTLALLGVMSFRLESSHRDGERRARMEEVLARCGEVLLANPEERAIDAALGALLDVAPVQSIFVDVNYEDPVVGLCARVSHEATRSGTDAFAGKAIRFDEGNPDRTIYAEIAYNDLPDLRDSLSKGEAATVHTVDLAGRAREIYEQNGCKSELNIPITINGEWVGSLGFADYAVDRHWDPDDLGVLQTAAAMIGSFWERGRAIRDLEELVKSKDQFLASISHEIRTPLTAVLGFSEVLRDEAVGLGPGGAEMVGFVVQQAREMADIVEDLLVAARADINALSVVRIPVPLEREVRAVIAARGRSEAPDVVVEDADAIATGDPMRIRQIIRCLISNASRYGGEELRVRVRRTDDRAVLTVSDNGSGVPPGHERHIFEAFHRAKTDDGTTQAIGLGLFVSHHLAGLMDGSLSYYRERDWTTFELDLPAASRPRPTLRSGVPTSSTEESVLAIGPRLVPLQ